MLPQITTDLSSVQIWDNLLDDRFLLDLDQESNYYNWHLSNVANKKSYPTGQKGSHLLWGVTFNSENCPENIINFYQYLSDYILKEKYKLEFIQLNGQSMGQNGTVHVDNSYNDGKKTLMVFINSKWKSKWGGDFQLLEEYNDNAKIIKSIKYVPGRVILFDGNIPHRGLSPTKSNIFRKSLVYRLTKNNPK
jgi:hypothetical protein